MATKQAKQEPRALRADAQRNLELVLDAAAQCFAEQGLEVGVADIAKRAGVGTGTIFRRFSCKGDLIEAVFERRVEEILAAAQEAAAMEDPAAGLRHFFEFMVRVQLSDRGCLEAAASHLWRAPRVTELRAELLDTIGALVERGKAAGVLREDASGHDIPVLVNAVAHGAALLEPASPGVWRRYAAIALDGLRPGGAAPLEPEAPTPELIERALKLDAKRRQAGH